MEAAAAGAAFPQAGDAPWQLFNLHDDPLETHDVAAQHPDRVKP
jgi:hypothetical protein